MVRVLVRLRVDDFCAPAILGDPRLATRQGRTRALAVSRGHRLGVCGDPIRQRNPVVEILLSRPGDPQPRSRSLADGGYTAKAVKGGGALSKLAAVSASCDTRRWMRHN